MQLKWEEIAALERFQDSIRRRELERLAARAPSGKRTLIFPGEPMPGPVIPRLPPRKSPD